MRATFGIGLSALLVSAAGPAHAAVTDPEPPDGSFVVTATVQSAQRWRETPGSTWTGTFVIADGQLTRARRVDRQLVTLTLAADGHGGFTGSTTYDGPCFFPGGKVLRDAYSYTETVTLTPTGDGFTGSLQITGTPTPDGIVAGCGEADGTLDLSVAPLTSPGTGPSGAPTTLSASPSAGASESPVQPGEPGGAPAPSPIASPNASATSGAGVDPSPSASASPSTTAPEGLVTDPATGQLVDPTTGLIYDATSGLFLDAATGSYYLPGTLQRVDPETGEPVPGGFWTPSTD